MNENYFNYAVLKSLKSLNQLPKNILYNLKSPYFLQSFILTILPKQGPYMNIQIKFCVEFPNNFPFNPPTITALQNLFHPNILHSSKVCLNILKNSWRQEVELFAVIIALLCLLEEPNFEDYANQEARDAYDNGSWNQQVLTLLNSEQYICNINLI
ncbi:Ubiquitin-conjugating enzyme E2 [Spironucleus salmonicida]|uniref:Ubiquitin-conjugating enzyme E2 n=1 Tax=Spironucleus salmonicida TaxID=348837 RepID=V6LFD2_9EUKA|nr:Ubiquitin-conjugating enzyme E2 [Spironucleus salmonicida]|eukprot:EST43003.1 Ubiquitin-conjugating enzyme E2 [Spironucleus salmonicida]